ncbi:nucleolar transcription factor 1-B-like [Impatiens glandulifera]|uniref:nucleolar transcription factor 1-B-like n=1 Tax=Impatiens glandulifera TaxID=253017 RepID=UPI001FB07CDA|nr:nucleolar transcription factor 1-B-like [Impatiens glandulifera]
MPSGAKKRRKAAKKKKTNGTQLHGEDDDLVVHDGKDSDGGDVGSPLSQHPDDDLHAASVGGDDDNDNDDDDDKEEEEEEEDPSSVRSNVAVENEPLLVENGESTVKVTVEEEIPFENSEFENKSTNQDPESLENPSGGDVDDDDGSDSSSSSSSCECSDDESHAIEKKKNIGMEDKIKAAFLELSNPVLLVEQKDEELAESPPLDLDLSSKPDYLPAEITQVRLSN